MQQALNPAAVLLVELHSQLAHYVILESDVKHVDVVLSRVEAERDCAGELDIGEEQCGQSIENGLVFAVIRKEQFEGLQE